MPWGIVIKAEESATLEFRLFGQIAEYQEAVGGWFEAVDINEVSASIFLNEEGKIHDLPLNRRATLTWWLLEERMRGVDTIRGDVIILGQPDDEGDTQDVPDALVTLLMKTDLYKYEVQTYERDDKYYGNQSTFDNYFSAANAALGLLDRWTNAKNVRVVAV